VKAKSLLLVFLSLCLCFSLCSSADTNEREQNAALNTEFSDLESDEFSFAYLRHRKLEEVNIFQKLKESLGAAIVGFILIIFMPCLIWKNEGRHVRELSRIDFCKNKAVVVNCMEPTDETSEQLVYFCGNVLVDDEQITFPETDTLNLASALPKGLMLKRTCYIYQKFEDSQQSTDKHIGGGETRTTNYSLREDWTPLGPQKERLENIADATNSRGIWDQLVAASGGNASETPTGLPPGLPPGMAEKLGIFDSSSAPHGMVVSKGAHVGGFALSSNVVMENPLAFAVALVPVATEFLPETIPGCEGLLKGSDNVLRTFAEGEQPQNGDCKVVYEYVMDNFECSFIVKQVKAADASYGVDRCDVVQGLCNNHLGNIWMVRKGHHSLDQMIEMAKEEEATATKLLRIVGWLGLMLGWVMLFSPFVTALEVLPFLGKLGAFAVVLVALVVSCLCCMSVSLVAYFRYRPLMSLGLLAIVAGIWALVIWQLDKAAQEGGP